MQIKANSDRIILHRRVLPGLDVLTPEETENFWKAVNSLEDFSPERPLPENITKFNKDEPIYVIKVDASLRAMLGFTEDNKIEIIDLFPQERIDFYKEKRQDPINEKLC